MNTIDELRELFRQASIGTSQQMDRKVVDSILVSDSEVASAGGGGIRPRIRRAIMKRKITGLAAAVVVVGMVGGVVYLLAEGSRERGAEGPGQRREATESISQGPVEEQKELVSVESPRIGTSFNAVAKPESRAATDGALLTRGRRSSGNATAATMGRRAVIPVDIARIEREVSQVEEMAAAGDIEGLIEMLSSGMYQSKVAAAEHLGEIGDDRALPMLKRLNKRHGGWLFGSKCVSAFYEGSRTSGAFAAAICKILTRDSAPQEQIEAWFDLLEGRGPVMPMVDELFDLNGAGPVVKAKGRDLSQEFPNEKFTSGFDLGERVAAELSKFDDPSVVARLRQTENKGAATTAVWMEVRDMEVEKAIERCMEIARNEPSAQQYGAVRCLGKFGEASIDALDELAFEGQAEAIDTLGSFKENAEVLDMMCWHLTNNKNSRVRLMAIYHFGPGNVLRFQEPVLLQTLTTALYDPNAAVRHRAAQLLRIVAWKGNHRQLLEYEDELLIALKHPDQEVRAFIEQALQKLDEAGDELPWGEAVEGLTVRLRPRGAAAAKRVTLLVDLRNDGPGTYEGPRSTTGCRLEVDGEWYGRILSRERVVRMVVKAGEEQLAFTQFDLAAGENQLWRGPFITTDGRVPAVGAREIHRSGRLELAPGRHTVRLARPVSSTAYACTNAVQIEILPEEELTTQIEGEQR